MISSHHNEKRWFGRKLLNSSYYFILQKFAALHLSSFSHNVQCLANLSEPSQLLLLLS